MTATAKEQPNGLPLFYQKPVALDKGVHAKTMVTTEMTLSFAAKVNAVPVTIVELPQLMQHYPIAFSAAAPATPLAVLGLRDGENLFVNKKGEWLADTYIPAYIRRYPFIFARNETGDKLTLCIDDADGILKEKNGNALFDDKGEPSPLTANALEFCRSYQVAAEQTQLFSASIEASNILVERHVEMRQPDGNVLTLSGFRQVDEEKFYQLPEATVLDWHKNHWTSSIYAHLYSAGNWGKLFKMMAERK